MRESRHILPCRDGCAKFATSSTDIRCRDPSRAAESTTESTTEPDTRSGGPRASVAGTNPTMGLSLFLRLFSSISLRFVGLPSSLPVAAFAHRIRLWPGLSGLSFLPFSFPFSRAARRPRLFSRYPTRSFGNHLRILPPPPPPRSSRGCYLYER